MYVDLKIKEKREADFQIKEDAQDVYAEAVEKSKAQ